MQILKESDPQACRAYEKFVSGHRNGTVLQSLYWPGVKKHWKHIVLLVQKNGRITGTALVLIRRFLPGMPPLLYVPRGPVCDYTDVETLNRLCTDIRTLARRVHAYQCILDPPILREDAQSIALFLAFGFSWEKDPPELATIQPRHNYMLSLDNKTEEEIFAGFHKKWRYNIRVSQRHGVTCTRCGMEALDDFYALLQQTGRRDGFPVRSKVYFARMLTALGERAALYLCRYENEPVSAALVSIYGDVTCYLYGASSSLHREVMPNYLMQWTMIRDALARGDRLYDFQGIPFYDCPENPKYGVYRFKKGFGGRIVRYAGEFSFCPRPKTRRFVEKALHFYRRLHAVHRKKGNG